MTTLENKSARSKEFFAELAPEENGAQSEVPRAQEANGGTNGGPRKPVSRSIKGRWLILGPFHVILPQKRTFLGPFYLRK